MKIKKVSFKKEPKDILQHECDCVWVWLANRKRPSPIQMEELQWIDWSLEGFLSKYIASEQFLEKETTFVPTRSRLPARYVAVEPNSRANWKQFLKNSAGLQLKSILCIFELGETSQVMRKELALQKVPFPESIAYTSFG